MLCRHSGSFQGVYDLLQAQGTFGFKPVSLSRVVWLRDDLEARFFA